MLFFGPLWPYCSHFSCPCASLEFAVNARSADRKLIFNPDRRIATIGVTAAVSALKISSTSPKLFTPNTSTLSLEGLHEERSYSKRLNWKFRIFPKSRTISSGKPLSAFEKEMKITETFRRYCRIGTHMNKSMRWKATKNSLMKMLVKTSP